MEKTSLIAGFIYFFVITIGIVIGKTVVTKGKVYKVYSFPPKRRAGNGYVVSKEHISNMG